LVQKLIALTFKQKVLIFRKNYTPKILGCYIKSQLALKDTTLTEAQAHAKSNARRLRMHRLISLRLSKRPKQHRIINLSIFGNYATIYENV
jgi:hypothetical protein